MIDAKEAERLGLINKVVPSDKLEEETLAFAQKLASKSPVAMRMGKYFGSSGFLMGDSLG